MTRDKIDGVYIPQTLNYKWPFRGTCACLIPEGLLGRKTDWSYGCGFEPHYVRPEHPSVIEGNERSFFARVGDVNGHRIRGTVTRQ